MIYWVIYSASKPGEADRICDQVAAELGEEYSGDDESKCPRAWGWADPIEKWPLEGEALHQFAPLLQRRLAECKSAVVFEGPADPHENICTAHLMRRYLELLQPGVMDWGDVDYGWPVLQTTEEALKNMKGLTAS